MSSPVRDLTRPLLAFWVGDDDIYAAEDEAQALALANAIAAHVTYTLDDVTPVGAQTLALEWSSRRGRSIGTLRGILDAMPGPGCLAGPGYLAGVDLA